MEEFIERDLTGARFKIVDLSSSRFSDLNLSGVLLRGVWADRLELDGDFGSLVVNGVDVAPYVLAEMDRLDPERVLMRPEDTDGFRTAWPIVERRWAETVERARRLPPELLRRAGGRGVVVHRDAAPPGDGDRRLGAARAARRPDAVPPAGAAALRAGRPVRHGASRPRRAAEPRRGAGGAGRPDGPGRRGDRRPHRRASRRADRAGARARATRRRRATRAALPRRDPERGVGAPPLRRARPRGLEARSR